MQPEDFMDEEDLGESHKAGNSLVVRDAFDRLTRDEDADVGAKVRRKVASSGVFFDVFCLIEHERFASFTFWKPR